MRRVGRPEQKERVPRRIVLSLAAGAALLVPSAPASAAVKTVTLKPTKRTATALTFTAKSVTLSRVQRAKLHLGRRGVALSVAPLRATVAKSFVVKVRTTKKQRRLAKLQLTLRNAASGTPAAAARTDLSGAPNAGNIPIGMHAGLRFRTGADLENTVTTLANAGVTVAREDFTWSRIEASPGNFDWASYDEMVGTAARHGVRILAIPDSTPGWAASATNVAPVSGPALTAYAQFIRTAIRRYGSNGSFWADNPSIPKLPIVEWDIWNEPYMPQYWGNGNGDTTDPVAYGTMFRDVVSSVEDVDPQAKFLLEADIGSWAQGQHRWNSYLGAMLDGVPGLAQHVDALSLHDYTDDPGRCTTPAVSGVNPLGLANVDDFCRLIRVREMLDAHGMKATTINITETGFSTATQDPYWTMSEAAQAAAVKAEFELLRKWRLASELVFYSLTDNGSLPASDRQSGFGLMHADGTPKPAWNVFVEQTRQGIASAA